LAMILRRGGFDERQAIVSAIHVAGSVNGLLATISNPI
jgi:hypothetical protein